MLIQLGRLELLGGNTAKFYLKPTTERFDNPYKVSQDYYGWMWSWRLYWLWLEFGLTWLA